MKDLPPRCDAFPWPKHWQLRVDRIEVRAFLELRPVSSDAAGMIKPRLETESASAVGDAGRALGASFLCRFRYDAAKLASALGPAQMSGGRSFPVAAQYS